MSGPSLQGALWTGNSQLATKNQLISSITGIYNDLQDLSGFNFQNLEVSTLTVQKWISTPTMYVSSLYAKNIDLSGIVLDPSGVFIVTDLSANKCSISFVSMSTLQFNYTMNNSLNISFDLGLGQAVGGALAGLGALVGGAFIGIGTAIGGTAQGIATLIAGRPQNFITNNTYETINFTSQLQISTIGYAQPIYSTIFRTVSSISANEVPGREIFTSSFFYPGQICIRTASDPFNLITGNPNLTTSTLQSFGQWVPLTGLEPENIVGNSISTNHISAGQAYIDTLVGLTAGIRDITANTLTIADSIPTPGPYIAMGYGSPINFKLGSLGNANIQGNINYMWIQSDQDIVFSKTGPAGTTPISGRIELGGANESVLNFSTINSKSLFADNATITNLVVTNFSTINSNSQVNILSTSVVEADIIYANFANISSMAPFKFTSSILGNPTGVFDITRVDTVLSTTYSQISSLQQNILNYSLNTQIQDQAQFNIGDNPGIGVTYEVTPANIEQWASTQIIFNGYQGPGGIDLGWVAQWGVTPGATTGAAPGGATFDVFYLPNPQNGFNAPFYLTEQSNRAYPVGLSTFYQQTDPNPPYPISFTARMTLPPIVGGSRSGWWEMTTPCPPPYTTSNNNTFQIFQDINDTYITGTDRLHIQAGDILLDGTTTFSNIQIQNLATTNLTALTSVISTISTFQINASNIQVSTLGSQQLTNNLTFTGGLNNAKTITPIYFTNSVNSTDLVPVRFLTLNSRGPNMFNSLNIGEWSNTMYVTPSGVTATNVPAVYLGDTYPTPLSNYGPAFFWINNATSPVIPIPIYIIKQPGSWLSTLGYATSATTPYTLLTTSDGENWTITSNRPYPGGTAVLGYSNSYQLQMSPTLSQLNVGMPFTEIVSGTKTIQANKIIFAANQLRTLTYASPSFPQRECGLEFSSYFDGNVIFTGSQSDAVNIIPSPQGNLAYACVAWNPTIVCGRMRTASLGIQGFEFEATVVAFSGTFADVVWASHRYINVNGPDPEANIREIYFMCPANWTTSENLIGPY